MVQRVQGVAPEEYPGIKKSGGGVVTRSGRGGGGRGGGGRGGPGRGLVAVVAAAMARLRRRLRNAQHSNSISVACEGRA